MSHIQAEEKEGVVVCTFDREGSSQNVLTEEFFNELEQLLFNGLYYGMPLVFISAKKDFLAGADVEQMAGISSKEAERLVAKSHEVLARLESRATRTVAAIQGQCLGGGLEFALACNMRFATEESRLGLPEVKLGIIPGFGGTQRLPRLIGLSHATQMIVSGHGIDAKKAKRIGLIDEITPNRPMLFERAHSAASKSGMPPRKRRMIWLEKFYIIPAAGKKIAQKANPNHYPAPFRALDVLAKSARKSDYQMEQATVCDLLVSPGTQNLIRLFLLTSRAKKKWPDEPKTKRTAVIGAGIMGSGIAYTLSRAGFSVRLIEKDEKKLLSALQAIQGLYRKDVGRKRLAGHEAKQSFDRISPSSELTIGSVDLVIEAVFEDYEVKEKVLKAVEARVSPETIIATNTSSLSVRKLAGFLQRPERFVGMHFFNPVEKMPLIEIVPSELTNEEVVLETGSIAKRMSKVPVQVKDAPGFIVNKILANYFRASLFYVPPYSPDEIDPLMRKFGMPMGPFELADQVGIDILFHAQKSIPPCTANIILELMVEKNFLGKKTGKGFYDWTRGTKKVNQEIQSFQKFHPREYRVERIPQTLHSALQTAAEELVRNGVASKDDVELAMVLGAGYPPFRCLFSRN